jgi:thymidylate synthase (FAD)
MKKISICYTDLNPISRIGKMAGLCWGANTEDDIKNYKRGLDCLESRHGRTWEFPDVTFIIEGYSARVIRELYTHIGGAPTRLQESTRYVDGATFEFVVPKKVLNNPEALEVYNNTMAEIREGINALEKLGIHKEDAAMLLPLGMETKVVLKINLRTLISMAQQRLCTRAYWEFRELIKDMGAALTDLSVEWGHIVDDYFIPKCEYEGVCHERYSCGRVPTVKELERLQREFEEERTHTCNCGGNCSCKEH